MSSRPQVVSTLSYKASKSSLYGRIFLSESDCTAFNLGSVKNKKIFKIKNKTQKTRNVMIRKQKGRMI